MWSFERCYIVRSRRFACNMSWTYSKLITVDNEWFRISSSNSTLVLIRSTKFDAGDKPRFRHANVASGNSRTFQALAPRALALRALAHTFQALALRALAHTRRPLARKFKNCFGELSTSREYSREVGALAHTERLVYIYIYIYIYI